MLKSLNIACITSNEIVSHFIFYEYGKCKWSKFKSYYIFLQLEVHNVNFKTVPEFVDIQFASWPKVMTKIKSTPQNAFFCKKCRNLKKTLPYIEKRRDSSRSLFFQNKNEKPFSKTKTKIRRRVLEFNPKM